MNFFEKQYGIKEDETIKKFHKSRRMFCIYKNELFIAKPNLDYSHAVWFEKEGWISKEKDILMDKIVRGIVNKEENIYFYVGYEFQVNDKAESIFFSHLEALIKKLEIKDDAEIFGGLKKEKNKLIPIREYGKLQMWVRTQKLKISGTSTHK
jgi:hypothetical protein